MKNIIELEAQIKTLKNQLDAKKKAEKIAALTKGCKVTIGYDGNTVNTHDLGYGHSANIHFTFIELIGDEMILRESYHTCDKNGKGVTRYRTHRVTTEFLRTVKA